MLHWWQVEFLSLSSGSQRCSARDEPEQQQQQQRNTAPSSQTLYSPMCIRILTSITAPPNLPSHFKHGRVNLLILQAASLPIYLPPPPPPTSRTSLPPLKLLRSGGAALSGSSRAAGLSGVMDDYQPSAVFHYAPGRFTGSLTTRHENQSLLLIPASLFPPSVPSPLLQSLSASISKIPSPSHTPTKKEKIRVGKKGGNNRERRAEQY